MPLDGPTLLMGNCLHLKWLFRIYMVAAILKTITECHPISAQLADMSWMELSLNKVKSFTATSVVIKGFLRVHLHHCGVLAHAHYMSHYHALCHTLMSIEEAHLFE